MRPVILFFLLILFSVCSVAQSFYLFVGTYTGKGSKGIYVYRFHTATGKAEWVSNTDSVVHPSYLTIAPGGAFLYSVNAITGGQGGQISAFSFNKETGRLTLVNQQWSGGDNPCYITVNKDRRWVIAGHYTGGSISAFPVNSNGSLQPYAQLIKLQGSGIRPQQEKAHVHATVFSPDQRYLFCPDLGTDKIMIYKFKASAARPLREARPSFIKAAEPGSGPRHFTFHPNNKFAYLIEELSGTVEAYRYKKGKLKPIQRIASHPEEYKGVISSADIHVSPDGRFLYASNRGDENTVTIFSVDAASGKLGVKGYQPTLGAVPRNFVIDPTGQYLLVAHQATDNIVIFKRDKQTGLLSPTGEQIKVPTPVCLKMLAMD